MEGSTLQSSKEEGGICASSSLEESSWDSYLDDIMVASKRVEISINNGSSSLLSDAASTTMNDEFLEDTASSHHVSCPKVRRRRKEEVVNPNSYLGL